MYKLVATLAISLLLVLTGCGHRASQENRERNETPSKAIFEIMEEEVQKVVIRYNDGPFTKELTERDQITQILKYLSPAESFDGTAEADLPRVIEVHKKDGTIVNLDISGGGSVFIDHRTKNVYKINSAGKPFMDWIQEIESE